ncbi:MAG TPA: LapA family protein [Candidatus Desulfaltia sp.]|nr:LapA family protein [Candidatus Desulfaltia sp.]
MKTKLLIIAVLLILLIILLVQNNQEVDFRIYFWKISMSQVILVPLAVLIGVFFGYFLAKTRKDKKD